MPSSLNPQNKLYLQKVFKMLSSINKKSHETYSKQLDSADNKYSSLKIEMDQINESLALSKTLLLHVGLKDQERYTYQSEIENI